MARWPIRYNSSRTGWEYPRLRYKRAQAHPIFETINRLREIYLSLGFDEIENPVIVEEQDIYRQFGPEAMAVLDRVFYIGGLPRPNVGIAKKQLDEINDILMEPPEPARPWPPSTGR